MQNQNNQHHQIASTTGPIISLTELLAPIVRARVAVLIITLLVVSFCLALSVIKAKYKSQGFFQFGGPIPLALERIKDKDKNKDKNKDEDEEHSLGITLSDFKRYASAYSTNERFNDFVQDKKLFSAPGVEHLRQTFASREGISRIIEPVYPFTKLDAKELMEQPKGSSNNVIGLRIEYDGESPEIAQNMVGLLGRYAMDSIVYLIYSDALRFKNEEIKTKLTELDSAIIRNKIKIDEYHRRAADLRQIIARNPAAANQVERQVVEIKEDTAHFLPPVTLLTTTEVQVAEANEAIVKAKHDQLQNQLLLEYYDRVKSVLDSTKSGEAILRALEPVKVSVFKDKNMQDDAIKEVFNMITVDNQKAINVYLNKSRFIAGPTLPTHSTVHIGLVLLASVILGLLLSVLFVFARSWQRNNQKLLSH